jgi:AcrR family transcriptional regulator
MKPGDDDLRARRRRETEREIHAATLRLTARHSFDQLTVDMISAEAGISRRTFFNYFPSKEAAVVFGPWALPEAALADFLTAPGTGPAQVLRDLTRLLVRELEQNAPDRDTFGQVFVLAQQHPGISAALLATLDSFERTVAAVAAQRLGREPGDDAPALLAAVALATMRTGLQRWAQSEQSSPLPDVERTVALLHALLAPEPVIEELP